MNSMSQFSHEFVNQGADAASSSSSGFGRAGMRGPQDIGFGVGNYGPVGGFASSSGASRVVNRDPFGMISGEERPDARQNLGFGPPYPNAIGSPLQMNNQNYPQPPSLQYQSQQDLHSLNSFPAVSNDRQLPMNQLQHSFMQSPAQQNVQSHWLQQDAGYRRPGPFDAGHPTSGNTMAISHASNSLGRSVQPVSNEQSPWPSAHQNVIGAGWGSDPSSLTVANLGQHNQQHEALMPMPTSATELPTTKLDQEVIETAQLPSTAAPAPAPEPAEDVSRPSQKQRRKSAVQPVSTTSVPLAVPAPAPIAEPPSPVQPVEHKVAWAINDENQKARPAGAPLNLREIQEADARKLEARKAAERERERALRAAAASASPSEELQTFTTTWGLPTSQAGAARTSAGTKESSSVSATAATPAWTTAAKAPIAKKTVKEIQEEEEKRKKQAQKEKETAAVAVRRAYAETTTKVLFT